MEQVEHAESLLNQLKKFYEGHEANIIGVSDLFTVHPELEKEWDSELNENIDITTLPLGSHTKVWWKCAECGHEWQAEIRQRVKGYGKCPNCNKNKNQLNFDF